MKSTSILLKGIVNYRKEWQFGWLFLRKVMIFSKWRFWRETEGSEEVSDKRNEGKWGQVVILAKIIIIIIIIIIILIIILIRFLRSLFSKKMRWWWWRWGRYGVSFCRYMGLSTNIEHSLPLRLPVPGSNFVQKESEKAFQKNLAVAYLLYCKGRKRFLDAINDWSDSQSYRFLGKWEKLCFDDMELLFEHL